MLNLRHVLMVSPKGIDLEAQSIYPRSHYLVGRSRWMVVVVVVSGRSSSSTFHSPGSSCSAWSLTSSPHSSHCCWADYNLRKSPSYVWVTGPGQCQSVSTANCPSPFSPGEARHVKDGLCNFGPIRGQYSAHVITPSQSEASIGQGWVVQWWAPTEKTHISHIVWEHQPPCPSSCFGNRLWSSQGSGIREVCYYTKASPEYQGKTLCHFNLKFQLE